MDVGIEVRINVAICKQMKKKSFLANYANVRSISSNIVVIRIKIAGI